MCCSGLGFSARQESKHPEGALGRGASGFSRATWQKEGFQGFFVDMKMKSPLSVGRSMAGFRASSVAQVTCALK